MTFTKKANRSLVPHQQETEKKIILVKPHEELNLVVKTEVHNGALLSNVVRDFMKEKFCNGKEKTFFIIPRPKGNCIIRPSCGYLEINTKDLELIIALKLNIAPHEVEAILREPSF